MLMRVENNVELKKYVTFRMGGIAESFYTPETEEELLELAREDLTQYCVGGGSNLLINDTRHFESVVNLREFSNYISKNDEGYYEVGASVRLQKLINTINEDGFGGIEYLYSVPGLVGGAVVMNAGRGKQFNQAISDYIIAVKVFHDGKIEWMEKEVCQFKYRDSVFKRNKWLVLAVKFSFPKTPKLVTEKLRKERIQLCKEKQDSSAPNFGTVFCKADIHTMRMFQNKILGKCGKIRYSEKTANWMLNQGGTFENAIKLINRVKFVHKLMGKECREEVIFWR